MKPSQHRNTGDGTIATTHKGYGTPIYNDGHGNQHEAVFLSWELVTRVLGHLHTRSPADDRALITYLKEQGAPDWVQDAEGWVEESGWGLIGPGLTGSDGCVICGDPVDGEGEGYCTAHVSVGEMDARDPEIRFAVGSDLNRELNDSAPANIRWFADGLLRRGPLGESLARWLYDVADAKEEEELS